MHRKFSVSVAYKNTGFYGKLRHLNTGTFLEIGIGQCKIYNKRSVPNNKHVGMRAVDVVVLASTTSAEYIPLLSVKMLAVVRAVNCHSAPHVSNHPIFARKHKYVRALLRLVARCDASVFPIVQIFAVSIAGIGLLAFILIPHTPDARGQSEYARIDNSARAKAQSPYMLPIK